ncbi:MAG: hypothetical protein PHC78_12220 [Verrucomicrobiota bacterium]|nr:hypothetical protein [Verrucomicrobiota bacterium]
MPIGEGGSIPISISISISTMIGRIGRIGDHCLEATLAWRRPLQFIPNGRAYDDLLQTLNLLGVLAVHLMGPAIAG